MTKVLAQQCQFFTNVHLVYRLKKCRGRIVGYKLRVFPLECKLPMSKHEALAIVTTIEPGALFRLHQRGQPDLIALRALEVLNMA